MCQRYFLFFSFFFCCNLAKEGAFSICTVNKVTVFHWFQQMFCVRKWIAVKHEFCLNQPFREGKLVVDGVSVPIKLKSSLFFKHTVFVTLTDALQPQGPKKALGRRWSCVFLPLFYFSAWLLQHTVVTVPGNHHVHLNEPENVAPIVSDFLRTRVLSQSDGAEEPMSKL